MQSRKLGKTGITISRIGLGCVTFGREIDEAMSFAVADRALERGITHFDTAGAYSDGESERVLGRWLRDRRARDRVVLATKAAPPLDRKQVLVAAEQSLKNLQTERIDLFYLHAYPGDAELEESLDALNTLVEQGKARCVGCSNFEPEQVAKALELQRTHGWARMEAVQPVYNLVAREIEKKLIPLCKREEIAVISYSPVGAGFLTGKYRRGGEVPKGTRFDVIPGHQGVYFHEENWRVMEALRSRSERTGVSMTHLALAWAIRQNNVTTTLIGARNVGQVDQAFEAQSMPAITDELLAELSVM